MTREPDAPDPRPPDAAPSSDRPDAVETDPSGRLAAEAAGRGPWDIDAEQRQTLARLADVLIPGADGMPSASEAGVTGRWLDEVLRSRPDLVDDLRDLLDEAHEADPQAYIARAEEEASAAIVVLSTVVPGAYFMNPEIQERIGYRGQQAVPIPDPSLSAEDLRLLQAVIDRGTIYRS